MKQLIFLLMISLSLTFYAEASITLNQNQMNPNDKGKKYKKEWAQVDSLEKQGLYKSALEVVEQIYTMAKADENSDQVIKSYIFRLKYKNIIEEYAFENLLYELRDETLTAKFPDKALMNSMLAEMYWWYYQNNRWKFYNRSETTNFDNNDIKTWSLNQLLAEVIKHYKLSIEDAEKLQNTSIDIYEEVISNGNKPQNLRPTLYDFLAYRCINFFSNTEVSISRPADYFQLNNEDYFATSDKFMNLTVNTNDTLSLHFHNILIFKELIKFHTAQNNREALLDANINRLRFVYGHSVLTNKDQLYFDSMQALSEKNKDLPGSALAFYYIAKYYYEQSSKYKPLDENTIEYKWYKKKALEICNQMIEKYPKSEGAEFCKSLKVNILYHSLSFKTENPIEAGQNYAMFVSYRNITKVYAQIGAISYKKLEELSEKGYNYDEYYKALLKEVKEVKTFEIDLPTDEDYNEHSLEYIVDGLPVGYYVTFLSTSPKFKYNKNIAAYSVHNSTNIAYFQRKLYDGSIQVTVVDRKTGNPLTDVKVEAYYEKYSYTLNKYKRIKEGKYTTDAEGNIIIKAKKNDDSKYLELDFYQNDDYYTTSNNFYIYHRDHNKSNYTKEYLFTDRAIYRPGQTVHFKGIVLEVKGEEKEIRTDYPAHVELLDANYQKVSDLHIVSNEYGTYSGTFQLPTGSLNGVFQLRSTYGSTTIRVEEYKRPKFEVEINPFDGNYRLNDTVSVKGNAKAFAGSKITNAEVKYRITREPQWRGWWYYHVPSSTVEIANGTIKTDDKGEFELKFNAIPDLSFGQNDYIVFNYRISVDVTDLNGETQSTSSSLTVGYKSLQVSLQVPSVINQNKADKIKSEGIKIQTKNLSGEFIPAKGTIKIYELKDNETYLRSRYWEQPDKTLYTQEQWSERYPKNVYKKENELANLAKGNQVGSWEFNTQDNKYLALKDIKKWKAGRYVAQISSKDAFGQDVSYKNYFTVYDSENNILPYNEINWFDAVKAKGEPGETAEFIIGSCEENVKIYYSIEHKGQTIHDEIITLNNEQKKITVPIEEKHRGNFAVHFAFVKNNRQYIRSQVITVPHTDKYLDIEFATFREKLYPGQEEEWKITIKGHKGEKVAAEMMATLYDASLDQFVPHNWYFSLYSSYYATLNRTTSAFSSTNSTYLKAGWDIHYYPPSKYYNTFNWFNFSYYSYFYHDRRLYSMQEVAVSGRKRNKVKKSEAMDVSMANGVEEVEDDETLIADTMGAATPQKTEAKKVTAAKPTSPEPEEPQEKPVKVRTNFNETAFFYPHLYTNSKGDVTVKFTVPESLTRWKMLGMAHTKDLKYNFIQNELVTQKDLMVMPNPPRFFRENDEIVFPVKISNISKKDLKGKVTLELIDAITLKPIEDILNEDITEKTFEVKSGLNTMVEWALKIPEQHSLISYRVIAKADKFSDGEEKPIPVMTNRMLVTESMPLPIRGKTTKNFELKKMVKSKASRTLKHHKLTLEFTSNPAWYAVQALPYIMEYPYECNEQIFSRFYANSIATHIANSNPKIKAVFDAWSKAPDSEALLSNLEKNQELKSVLLQETPWVLDAQDESQRKKQIALLFDLNRMANELETAQKKLIKAQTTNGGWPWFKGMPESRYITQHIVTGMGHLDKLGIQNVRDDSKVWKMIQNAVSYLDNQIVKEYEWLLKNYTKKELDENHLSYMAIHYLYGRSYFTNIEIPSKTKEAFEYYKNQAEKYWLKQSIYMQGMLALALHRYESTEVSQLIIRSLKERSLNNEEMGMYWKENSLGMYWYQAPIETQALFIEAFSEIANDQQTVEDMKVWLLKQKQTQDWKTTKATVEAIYALLMQGTDQLADDELVEVQVGKIKVNPNKMDDVKVEAGTGYFKKSWTGSEITHQMGKVKVTKKTEGVAWGSLYWQYFEQLDKITMHETPLAIKKQLFKEVITERGAIIEPINKKSEIKIGDKIIVRIEIRVDRAMEYVHMKDMRASGFEPINVLSQYKYQDGLGYYESTKDASTNFFIAYLGKGTYVFEYPLRVSHKGDFSNGITTIQCMYAPEFTSHSEGIRVKVEK